MSAIWMRMRAELRGKWRSSLLIVLLIGLAGGVALTAAAGARRTDTAYPRFLTATNSEDYVVSAQYSGAGSRGLYAAVARLPEVERTGVIEGLPLVYTPAPGKFDGSVQLVASVDGKAGYSVERLHMLSGRAPDPSKPFEVAASLIMARKYHVHAGDHLTFFELNDKATGPAIGPDGKPVTITFLVTGVEVSFDEIIPIATHDALPQVFGTPALVRKLNLPGAALNYDGTLVKLRPGADPGRFREDVARLSPSYPEARGYFLADEIDHHARVERAIRPEAIALALFALLAGLAGVLAVGQVISRRIFVDALDYPTLRSLGMSEPQLASVAAIRGAVLASVGGALAVAIAFLASPLMPIGPARIAEPHRGFEFNMAVLGAGFSLVVLAVTGIAAITGWRAARAEGTALGTAEVRGADRPSRVASRVRRAGVAPSVVNGVRFALEPGRGRSAVPVRTAMLGTIVAVAAITASFTFGTNLSRLVSEPSQYGRTWSVDLDTGFGHIPQAKIDRAFGGDPDVTAYAGGVYGAVVIDGHQIPTVGIDPLRGSVFPTLIKGRPPATPDEIVLGAKTLRLLHATVGETLAVNTGAGAARQMRVVGEAVFPSMGHGSFNPTGLGEGAATVAALFQKPHTFSFILARLHGGIPTPAEMSGLRQRVLAAKICPADQECALRTHQLPAELTTYGDIKTVPQVLALVLILMGVAITAHTLVTSVQRRRRDLATLKTLGFVRPQILTTVISQATVFAAVGLVIGIPLGIAMGRWAWSAFADQLGVPPAPTIPLLVVGLAIPVTLLLANLAAALPGRSAARTRPAVVLRAE